MNISRVIVNGVITKLPNVLRNKLLNKYFCTSKTEFRKGLYFEIIKNVCIGEECFINNWSKFICGGGDAKIKIGNNVYIGTNVSFITVSHQVGSSTQRAGENVYRPITIKNGCWIGANVTILPGVTIEEGCVIAAGSVVTKSCEKNCMYAGVPAQKKKCFKV